MSADISALNCVCGALAEPPALMLQTRQKWVLRVWPGFTQRPHWVSARGACLEMEGWMDGCTDGCMAKARTEMKQIHRWGKGGHVHVAVIAT